MADAKPAEKDEADDPKSDKAILKLARDRLKERISEEATLRELMLDDLKFATLDQWPPDIRAAREADGDPCLTIDQINQYITQVSNDMRKNRPSMKARPVDDKADVETAKIFAGLFRHIEDASNAQVAYATSGNSAVTIGLGYFRIVTDYVEGSYDQQDIFIRRVPDTFSVYLGPHVMPDGSDAEYGFVAAPMSKNEFKRRWPKAKFDASAFEGLGEEPVWATEETVTVAEYFYKHYEDTELLFLSDGTSVYADKYDGAEANIKARRPAQRASVKWCFLSGAEILGKRDWLGKYIPIIEEVGKEQLVEGKRMLWGLVRPAKDALRNFNYWSSALTAKMALAPLAPFVGAVGQFETQSAQWDQANRKKFSRLEYDPKDVNGQLLPPPRRQEPTEMEAAVVGILAMMQNNVKSSLGMYKAALGESESQQSGRAILALQKESDAGTMHFGENQAISITHAGRIIIDLAPKVYDTRRVLRILGEDGTAQSVQIDPKQQTSRREIKDAAGNVKRIYNLGVGTYDVTVTVGPGYSTQRQETATALTELANSAKDPAHAAVLGYLAVKNSDFAGSEETVRMMKLLLPPQLQTPEGNQPEIPPAARAKLAEAEAHMHAMQEAGNKLAQELQQAKSGQAEAFAKIAAKEKEAEAELAVKERMQARELQLLEDKTNKEIKLKNDIAAADYAIEQKKLDQAKQAQQDKARFDQQCRAEDMAHQAQTEGRANEEKLMPRFMEMLTALMQKQDQFNAQLIHAFAQAVNQPHVVSLGNIQRNDSGQIVGAAAVSKPAVTH